MTGMTLRERLEAIRDRHQMDWGGRYVGLCCDCGRGWPCRDSQDAVAALEILEASDFACGCSGEPGTFHLATADEGHPNAHPIRLVHDA